MAEVHQLRETKEGKVWTRCGEEGPATGAFAEGAELRVTGWESQITCVGCRAA